MAQQTTQQPECLIADAVYGIRQLEQSRRELCVEYNKRIRKLRDTVESLQSARLTAEHSGELFDTSTVIDPSVLTLIRHPCAGM
jgi:hypothetical protein